jgi:hypothetical protein
MPNLGGSLSDLRDIDQAIEKLKDRKTAREVWCSVSCPTVVYFTLTFVYLIHLDPQVTRLMDQVAPEIMRGLLHERDEYMARKIRQTPGTKLVR